MAIINKEKKYKWEFANIGGASRVKISTGEDIAHLDELDPKMWTVLSCPTTGLDIDEKSLKYIDTDCDGRIRVGTSQRSSINSARHHAAEKVEASFLLAGAEVTHEGEYPGWKPQLKSPVLELTKKGYRELFGVEPIVRAIHAGLECGLILDKYPKLDMISFGPTIRGVHAPGERLELASLDKFNKLLEYVIVNCK